MSRSVRVTILIVALLMVVLGPAVTSAQEAVSLELWTFVNTHARWFREQAERYQAEVNPNL